MILKVHFCINRWNRQWNKNYTS